MKMALRSFLLLALAWKASSFEFGLTNPFELQDFSCSLEGAAGQDVCDASHATDGTQCVWCSFQSFGVCVSDSQASAMKKAIPGLTCDNDQNDDNAPSEDDDVTPDNYWKCLKGFTDQNSCTGGGCEWCSTKAGYGICLDPAAAAKVEKYSWFDCVSTEIVDLDLSYFQDQEEDRDFEDVVVSDPYDPTCLEATLSGDATTCQGTTDTDGNPCEWCSLASSKLCLNSEQAQIVKQFGGDCSSVEVKPVKDLYDTSCLMATLAADKPTCESTVDGDGNGCEWCSINTFNICLNGEQAQVAEQIGGECSSATSVMEELEDPYDPTCLQASLSGDATTCQGTVDTDGNRCEWCSLASSNLCLNAMQAEIVEQFGGDCAAVSVDDDVKDLYDTSCLMATLAGGENTCSATIDGEGNVCKWCSVNSMNVCLNTDQAEMAQQIGGDCGTVN